MKLSLLLSAPLHVKTQGTIKPSEAWHIAPTITDFVRKFLEVGRCERRCERTESTLAKCTRLRMFCAQISIKAESRVSSAVNKVGRNTNICLRLQSAALLCARLISRGLDEPKILELDCSSYWGPGKMLGTAWRNINIDRKSANSVRQSCWLLGHFGFKQNRICQPLKSTRLILPGHTKPFTR